MVRETEVAREGGLYEKAVVVVAAVGVVLKVSEGIFRWWWLF